MIWLALGLWQSAVAPAAQNDAVATLAGVAVTLAAPGVLANDTGDGLRAVLVKDVAHGQLTLHPDGSFSYTPAAGFVGYDEFSYRAVDRHDASSVATVAIGVGNAAVPASAPSDAAAAADPIVIELTIQIGRLNDDLKQLASRGYGDRSDPVGIVRQQIDDANRRLQQRLEALKRIAPLAVLVSGEVRVVGEARLMPADMTLLRALAAAGGFGPMAADTVEVHRRLPSGEMQITRVNRDALESGRDAGPPLQNGDAVFVPRGEVFYVNGLVKSGGERVFRAGMTVGRAIAAAGGLAPNGSRDTLKIRRVVNGTFTEIQATEETEVQPLDEIVVAAPRPAPVTKVFVQGAVLHPGEITLKSGDMTLMRAILAAGGLTPFAGATVDVRHGMDSTTYDRREVETGVVADPVLAANDRVIVSRAPMFFVTGAVRDPGEKPLQPGMTVARALAISGGSLITDGATYRIRRLVNGKYEELTATLEALVQPDDEVMVIKKSSPV